MDQKRVGELDYLRSEFAHAARIASEAEKVALRYLAIRPYLRVGETEDGEMWGLWCLAEDGSDCEYVNALYARPPLTDAEESRREAGEPDWGPDCDAMVDEMTPPPPWRRA